MRVKSLAGKLIQLQHAPPSLWWPFIRGWMNRHATGIVPCVMPLSNRLLYVPLMDFYGSYEFACERKWEREELIAFLRQLRPGDVLYDIGGFRGNFCAASKLKLADAIAIHVFEPLQPNREAIERVCTLNRFSGVVIVPLAVGDGDSISGRVNSRDGMLRCGDPTALEEVRIASVSLDAYISRGAPPPTVMKIDVEGYEASVLRGSRQCLEKHRPRLWLEVHPNFLRSQGSTYEELLGWLGQIGYAISFFFDYESPHRETAFHVWCT